jgi:hypothetical protein
MKNLSRIAMKLSLAVALPLVLFQGAGRLPGVQQLLFGLRVTSIQYFGTPAEYQALVEQTARESAERDGRLEIYLIGEKLGNAMHELEARDPRMTDFVVDISMQPRDLRQEPSIDVAQEAKRANAPMPE